LIADALLKQIILNAISPARTPPKKQPNEDVNSGGWIYMEKQDRATEKSSSSFRETTVMSMVQAPAQKVASIGLPGVP
jgi:hypothetical protein